MTISNMYIIDTNKESKKLLRYVNKKLEVFTHGRTDEILGLQVFTQEMSGFNKVDEYTGIKYQTQFVLGIIGDAEEDISASLVIELIEGYINQINWRIISKSVKVN